MAEGKNLYDLLQALVDRTAWKTEEEAKSMGQLLRQLRELDALGSLTGRIHTKTEVTQVDVVSENVRQLRGDILGERPRLAAGESDHDD